MLKDRKTPIYNPDDDTFLGYVAEDRSGWKAETIFGYIIARTETEKDAERIIRDQGATYLKGVWQYYDKEDQDWFPCVIKQAYDQKVIVNRTTPLGYQDHKGYKQVIIENPTENDLIKSS